MFTYAAHGLTIAAPFRCPELTLGAGEPDVSARVGPFVAPSNQADYAASADEFFLSMTGFARFLVRRGREVTIEPAAGVDDEAIRPFFLGTCLGVVLHQRGMLALHASAARTPRGAVLALGDSGAGKSTLVAALVRRGCQLIADDVCAVVPDGDGWPNVLPGVRRLKLSQDAAAQVGLHRDDRPLVHARGKVSVPVSEPAAPQRTPLRAVYLLERFEGGEPRFEPLEGAERIWALTAHTYRPWYLDGLGRRADNFRQVLMAARVPVTRIKRPSNLARLDALAGAVLRHLETNGNSI